MTPLPIGPATASAAAASIHANCSPCSALSLITP